MLISALRRLLWRAPPAKLPQPTPASASKPSKLPKKAVILQKRSLFAEILDWMLAPLLVVWPLTVILTYSVAERLANQPYDRALEDQVRGLSRQVLWDGNTSYINLPSAARNLLRADDTDQVFFQVRNTRNRIIAGDPDLGLPDADDDRRVEEVRYRTDTDKEEPVRIAYLWVAPPEIGAAEDRKVLVQVGETLGKRTRLATEIVKGVILPQFIVLPISVLLVWFGLSRGIAPLNQMQARLQARKPGDLSPIPLEQVPEELSPLIVSFNELLLRLELNMQAQKRFVSDAAHQLKTPLAGLRLQAELASTATQDAEREESLRNIARGSRQATRLVNQLLVLARAEAQSNDIVNHHIPKTKVDLSLLAQDIAAERVGDALAQGHDLGLEAETPVFIQGNETLLRELLKNLIDNALTYAPPATRITVRVTENEATALLEVEDTGLGIPMHERSAVLQPFYRVLGTGKDGSGLGLAIVQHITAQHQGSLSLLDNPHCAGSPQAGLLVQVSLPKLAT